MRLKLTNYGKRVMMTAAVILMAAVLLTGALFCLFNWAGKLGIGQMFFNVIYIAVLMPCCVFGISELMFRVYYLAKK